MARSAETRSRQKCCKWHDVEPAPGHWQSQYAGRDVGRYAVGRERAGCLQPAYEWQQDERGIDSRGRDEVRAFDYASLGRSVYGNCRPTSDLRLSDFTGWKRSLEEADTLSSHAQKCLSSGLSGISPTADSPTPVVPPTCVA
jgi:hypothetical protein